MVMPGLFFTPRSVEEREGWPGGELLAAARGGSVDGAG